MVDKEANPSKGRLKRKMAQLNAKTTLSFKHAVENLCEFCFNWSKSKAFPHLLPFSQSVILTVYALPHPFPPVDDSWPAVWRPGHALRSILACSASSHGTGGR